MPNSAAFTSGSRVDQFLSDMHRSRSRRGNLVFALDATHSRSSTWDAAITLQAGMLREVQTLGNLSILYYRGVEGAGGECRASRWVEDPMLLAPAMAKVQCAAGETQIRRVLDHVAKASAQRKIHALVFVGDACEEHADALAAGATSLAALGVPAFMFQEGRDRTAQLRFEDIARITGGAYRSFDQGSLAQLAELLKLVAVFSVGGVSALEREGSSAARLLLGQIRR